jgi:hypothetical protein
MCDIFDMLYKLSLTDVLIFLMSYSVTNMLLCVTSNAHFQKRNNMYIRETLGYLYILSFAQLLARSQCASRGPCDQPTQHRLSGYFGFLLYLSKYREYSQAPNSYCVLHMQPSWLKYIKIKAHCWSHSCFANYNYKLADLNHYSVLVLIWSWSYISVQQGTKTT